jgi:hypothetical protein
MRRNYDLELQEFPIRDVQIARQLIEMLEWCPEVGTCLRILTEDIYSSENGDNHGFTISDTLEDDETPVDPDVKSICLDLLSRSDVIGGLALERAIKRMLGYGDTFLSLGIDREGVGKKADWGISRSLLLPTWELFRIEADNGELLGFEQRRNLSDSTATQFYPPQIVHFRHDRQSLYGRSIWRQSIPDWARLKASTENLATAARNLGINPNVHIMPEGVAEDYSQNYRADYEARLEDGLVTDFYMLPGGDVRKLANYDPNLTALAEDVLTWRTRLIMPSQIPLWRFAGFKIDGAKDLSGEPAKAYARHINSLRMVLTEGIKQVLNTELILRLGLEAFLERGHYQIVYPQIMSGQMSASAQVAPE